MMPTTAANVSVLYCRVGTAAPDEAAGASLLAALGPPVALVPVGDPLVTDALLLAVVVAATVLHFCVVAAVPVSVPVAEPVALAEPDPVPLEESLVAVLEAAEEELDELDPSILATILISVH